MADNREYSVGVADQQAWQSQAQYQYSKVTMLVYGGGRSEEIATVIDRRQADIICFAYGNGVDKAERSATHEDGSIDIFLDSQYREGVNVIHTVRITDTARINEVRQMTVVPREVV
jgi:hypothetical protein